MSICTGSPSARARPWRQAVVVATVVLAGVIGLVVGTFLVAGRGGAQLAPAAGYVPADAVGYLEARLDLRDQQRAELERLLARFSGIAVEKVTGPGLAAELDRLVEQTGVEYSYSEDVAPWFDGHVAMALLDPGQLLPEGVSPLDPMAPTEPNELAAMPGGLILLGTRDAAATTALLDRIRADAERAGASSHSVSHAGVTIWTIGGLAPDAIGKPDGVPAEGAYAITDDQLILGVNAGVIRTALDVHGGSAQSFASREEITAALAALPPERVGTFVTDAARLVAAGREALAGVMPELEGIADVYASGLSMLQVGSLRFEADRVVVDVAGSMPSRGMENSVRAIAEVVPADALVYLDGSGIGAYLAELVTAAKQAAVAAGQQATISQVEAVLGADLEAFVAWVAEAAVVAGWDVTEPWGGPLITPSSVEEAQLRLGQLRALAGLAGMAGGDVPLIVTEETTDGVSVTRFEVDAGGLGPPVIFEYAVTEQRVLLGFGDTFVERVLGTDAGGSLATSERFTAAVDWAGGGATASVMWADLAGIRDVVLGQLPADARTAYDDQLAEWLEPLGTLIGVMRVDGELVVSRGALVAD